MSSFYEYMTARKSTVAMDENTEKTVTIRRIFRIDPKVQKELGHEEKPEEDEKKTDEAKAEDSAIFLGGFAMDLSPRHSKTSIEDCRAKDPRYCPYHGADFMTNQLNEEFKKAGIYATGGVERLGQGKFKVQYSVPESKKGAATDIIDKFLSSPGFEEVSEADSDEVDAIAKEVKMDHGNDDFAMKEEHLDTLEKDMKKGMEVDPSALYQLRKDHYELKKLSKAAHEAMERDGINIRTKEGKEWAKTNPDWSKYRDAMEKFEADYNELRGNADLAHIKTPADCTELMGHLEKQITQVGDFVKATDEIEALKDKKGLKGKRGIPGTTDFNNAKGKIRFAIDGLKAARKQVEAANASGDIKKMRAAAHSLELVLNQVNEGKEDIANALKQAESYKKVLEGYPDAGTEGEVATPKAEEKKSTSSSEKKEEPSKSADALDDVRKYLDSRKDLAETTAMKFGDGSITLNREDNFKGKDVDALAKEIGDAIGMNGKSETIGYSPDDPSPSTFIRLTPKKEEPKSDKKEKSEKKDEPSKASKETKKTDSTKDSLKEACEDFLFTDDDDHARMYGEVGLSADFEHEKYRDKMDEAISRWKSKAMGYMSDDWTPEFKKECVDGLAKELRDIADEQHKEMEDSEAAKKEKDSKKDDDEPKGEPRDAAETFAKKVDKEAGAGSHLDELMKKAHAEVEASTKAMKERSDAMFGPEAAKAYLDSLKSKPSHESKSPAGVDKERFVKRYSSDVFNQITDTAANAKSAGKKLTAWTGIEDYDADDDREAKRFHSLQSLVKKLGGEVVSSKESAGEDGARVFNFTIDPDKAHELYGKLDARGGRVPHYEVAK